MKKHNFSAGPCILPQEVLKKASEAIINFNDDNLSLIEISHRSQPFIDVMTKAQKLVEELLEVPEGYSVLFLQGGASLEFLMVPFNLMKKNGKAAYTNTGTWAKKAITEAKSLGNAIVVGDDEIINKDGLRNSKEFVNHKILDCIGDLFTSGYRIIGSVKCSQGGHYYTNQILRKLFNDSKNFSIIEIKERNLPHNIINKSLLRSIA